ncbi:putative von willebrand factor type a [Diplodia seriata]|uniref:Midasin n=1 Tax=Diplodia seriata TaxID=420778 RepID=A0A0G2DZB1_9PEZI|nr:putative von willebrand factor type a [Diplodia seriata]
MECGWGISALRARPEGVSEELRSLLRPSSNRDFLADLAREALNPRHTDYLFALFEPLFVEIRALWATSYPPADIIPAYARILQLAPYLSDIAETILSHGAAEIASALQYDASKASDAAASDRMVSLLLGLFRLLVCDNETFGRSIQPLSLQPLLAHPNRTVRYLAIRCLCLYLHAADAAQEEMISRYVGQEPVSGDWEGKAIDYRFLSLWEEKRYTEVKMNLVEARSAREAYLLSPQISRIITQRDLGPHTAEIHGVLLPRSDAPSAAEGVQLIPTGTTVRNLTSVAKSLNSDKPVMLTGLAGSGKTLMLRHLARELNKLESMVTLHLNEQSDAKLLIGMYTTGSTPGTFTWRPGVLTTAVREGRWVLIEDLDRAPNDVISTLLPLIESGELLIPSRGEVVRAARGFKIIATLRTSLNLRGEQIVPGAGMIGTRFWERISIEMPREEELGEIVQRAFSNIPEALVPQIMSVYGSLQALSKEKTFTASRSGMIRPVTSRDLFKWCSRINPRNLDDMFLEAVDCLAGSLEYGPARELIVANIARELHVDPQKRDHLLLQRTIAYKTDDAAQVTIGRATVKRSQRKRRVDQRPFAANDHTRRLLERIAVAVNHQEPLLLVGETGTGKTTAIQHLATELGRRMEVFNLSQQSESGDLLGGFKPVNLRSIMVPMKDRFDDLFLSTFSQEKNRLFLNQLNEHMSKGRWKAVCKFWQQALRMVDDAVKASRPDQAPQADEADQPKKKKRKVEKQPKLPASFSQSEWDAFANDLKLVESQIANKSSAFAFKFVEGNIVKAVRNGDWVLLDEINLAAPDTLEALADLLTGGSGGTPSILLTETGNVERIEAHPNFRVFAAMNPATDVGKKDLPMGIRSRFTELYVESPDRDFKSLQSVVETYLDQYLHRDRKISADVANLYLHIQALNAENRLVDGANQKPHFSLRTLTRTLIYSLDTAPLHSLRRALYEGFCMSFLTFLDKSSEDLVAEAVVKYLKPQLGSPLQKPAEKERDYVQIRRDDGRRNHDLKKKGISKAVDDANFEKWLDGAGKDPQWLRRGRFESSEEEHYIITNFVWRNLTNLIRAASTRRFPVLIQGPTSAGKTSMIEYLAKRSGNKFVRINNHEHTDLQEYLGTYVSGNDGKLQFQEGILVKALREGHWIVLDELNLAPTDVLEALNRLLDDNRELLIPETQEIVRPHEDFMLFATQNPAGLYGGRKTLSRAFRNRFLELHFDDIPVNELKYILERRTQLPRSWCEHIVNVYRELSILRQSSRLFESKSFATLRDLFRWAMRAPETSQELAEQGYMLLAERVRKAEERLAVKQIIEKVIKQTKIEEDVLYSAERSSEMRLYQDNVSSDGVVWTRAMRRLYALVANALRHNEPVLLVGETGCGKTTVCQMLADAFAKQLFIVNAHQNTETGDLIGAQRPIRNRAFLEQQLAKDLGELLKEAEVASETSTLAGADLLALYDKLVKEQPERLSSESRQNIHAQRIKLASLFEWADGSLVTAMKTGQYFLLDEISLADDSVLERLNSVLESSRNILLAEKGPTDSSVNASDGFQFLATMNPGGDYGKKELSPALRNRFTEIYVPALSDLDDITQIVKAKLMPSAADHASTIVNFSQWFNEKFNTSAASSISIRDTLAWVHFINRCGVTDPVFGVVHGAAMVFIDTLGANPAALLAISAANIDQERATCLEKLSELVNADAKAIYFAPAAIGTSDSMLSVGDFAIPRIGKAVSDPSFSMAAPTTKSNAMRVLRALQLPKPILLEGNPGVGKTTLVTAISKAVGMPLTRINLSEQTDLMDLFGSDVPVEGAQAGTFAWKDAPFLKAMKNGEWVLLDEMNLASQSVLEGLNACLDHRGEVYISELDQTFHQNPGFRVFAAQNPHHQGGGRKGLPASFVNRFTVVYADIFRLEDLVTICKQQFPETTERDIETLTGFISELDTQVTNRKFGALGGPWEFNLRDTLRWLQLLTSQQGLLPSGMTRDFLDTVITQRFRSEHDRKCVITLFEQAIKSTVPERTYFHNLGKDHIQVGLGLLPRHPLLQHLPSRHEPRKSQLAVMESMMIAVQLNWPVILVGPPGSGKTSLVKQLASAVGAELVTSSMNADIDAMDLVADGEAKIVKPHPNFRIFMTMDARHALELMSGTTKLMGASQDFINAQTIHPLNNQSLVLYSRAARPDHSPDVSNDAYLLGGLLDLCMDLKKMQTLLQRTTDQAGKVKIRDRTRLGRSLVPSKAASKSSKDPFVGVGPFLQSVFDTLAAWVLEVLQGGFVDEDVLGSIKPIRQFWFDLFNLTNTLAVEDAVFQVCLAIGHQVFSQLLFMQEPRLAGLQEKLAKSLASLKLDSQLSTGLSMELLWTRFKPHTPPTYDGLLKLLKLEALADRLDASVWLTDAPLADLARVRSTLAGAMQIARSQDIEIGELIGQLEVAIDDVEKGVREGKEMVKPWFTEAFEGICQFSDLAQLAGESKDYSTTPTLTLLAQRPTRATPLTAQSFAEALLSRISTYLGAYGDVGPVALKGGYHVKLLKDVVDLDGANLAQMDLLRSEIDVLGQSLVNRSGDLLQDQTSLLAGLHQRILKELVHAHSELLDHEKSTANAVVLREDLPQDHYLRTGLKLLQHSLDYAANLGANDVNAGQAWISLAIAFLWLYVPDRPFDPALRPLVERSLFGTHRDGLAASLAALRRFEQAFTGRAVNLRTRLVEQDIAAMGTEPSVPAIARPPLSELAQLSGEFGNLLRVLDGLVRAVDAGEVGAMRDATLEMNIQQIVKRLSEGYRGYDDITAPVITFLQCLRVGVILAAGDDGADVGAEVFDYVAAHTPFFGGSSSALVPASNAVAFRKTNPVDLRWHALSALAVKLSVQPEKTPSINDRNLAHDIFRSFYEQWKEKLEADQEKAAEQSGLYRFKGGLDAEEEATEAELQSLFPDFEQQGDAGNSPTAPAESPQELARRLAVCHADIFVNRENPTERVNALIAQATEFVSKIETSGRSGLETSLPAIFLALNKQSEHLLQDNPSPRHYNFYTDANVSEAKKLVALIHRVQKRFRQIQEVWPEHATLADVLRESDELLAFRHVEPVAKFLTKGEKLHACIYQWQQVASREFSAAPLYDEVTSLLVSWRQLELTTWARLFDIEVEKAKDDAKGWFFVAYQTIIAATESLGSGVAMEDHVQELLSTLEQFALSTTAGQYHERLRLLEQFREQLALREVDEPSVRPVRTALDNFIRYFMRFAQPVRELVAKGRAALEKDMKNVLKVASWKDRNIDALRQSAKTSHKKLFRVVRKFRDILNKPVDAVLSQDLPEPAKSSLASAAAAQPVDAAVDAAAVQVCEQYVPGWSTRPSRFKDLSTTVKLMHRMTQPTASSRKDGGEGGTVTTITSDGAAYIQDFLDGLETSIAELQKATPAKLTDDNKNEVKHLKSRKRKLFADTLKELREMGFRSHVGGDVLERQDGLAKVLARLPTLPPVSSSDGGVARGAEEYLHKTFNLMRQVRDVAREHSGDLTNADVARCIGSFESMLHASLKQREVVAKVLEEEEALGRTIEQIKAVSSSSSAVVVPGDDASRRPASGLPWIAPMLRVAAHVVGAQAQLGKIGFAEVVEGLLSRAQSLEGLVKEIDGLPALPKGLSTAAHEQLANRIDDVVEEAKRDVGKWRKQHPVLEATLNQLLPWLQLESNTTNGVVTENARQDATTSIADLATTLFSTLDAILGSIQDVEKTHATLPTTDSPDSPPSAPSWLAAESATLAASCKALHAPRITAALHGGVLNQLRNVAAADNNGLHAACALLAALSPLITQYRGAVAGARARLARLHAAQARLAYRLAKAFLVVGARGFCTPSEEEGEGGKGDDDKLEGGTGLGEGEGAEDISKDVGEDEDLTELAREYDGDKEEEKDEQEQEDNAVDMGEEEMEGRMGEEKSEDEEGDDKESGDEEDEDEMDEEAGDVDDLGPSAVDEKMWDDGGKDDEDKDREGNEEFGSKDEDELAGAKDDEQQQKKKEKEQKDGDEGEQNEDEEPEEGAEEEERIGGPDEQEPVDPHMQEGETLDLPDDLNMDDDEKSDADDEDLGDMDDGLDDAMGEDENAPPDDDKGDGGEPEEAPVDLDQKPEEVDEMADEDKEDQAADPEEQEQQEQVDEGELKGADDNNDNAQDNKADNDDAAETGLGMDAHEDKNDDKDQTAGAQREDGAEGEASEEQQQDSKEQGARGKASQQDAVGRDEEETQESAESQPFKKLGDMLEKWYNQQRQIQNASEKQDEQQQQQQQQQDKDVDMADADFEHLQDEEAEADTQALGAAEEDQARGLDREMAQDVNDRAELPENLPAEVDANEEKQPDDVPMEDIDADQRDAPAAQEQEQDQQPTGQPNAFMGEPGDGTHDADREDSLQPPDLSDSDSDVDAVDRQLSSAAITDDDDFPRSLDSARALWQHHEASTRPLAQGLTEQLRLILAPTLATKMRGGHRTGKRLNMKAIIPYIASQYKRDKIWLRRSLPSKRAYQIALALDDSKSMADGAVAGLAFETLALVSKALSTLEAGEMSVLRFGGAVDVAWPFEKPFTGAEAGVDVFRRFGFDQERTDVKVLIQRVIEVFAEARLRASGAAKELWQLAVVISDGVCDGHADVARLVRKAQEERIMIVFVVVDGGAGGEGGSGGGGLEMKKNSVLDLLDVSFVDGKVVKRRYMDTFPFRWYVVVRDVRELPGVLSTALRQWFAEVVDTAG